MDRYFDIERDVVSNHMPGTHLVWLLDSWMDGGNGSDDVLVCFVPFIYIANSMESQNDETMG